MRHHCFAAVVAGLILIWASPVAAQSSAGESEVAAKARAYRLFMEGRHLEGEGNLDGAIQAYRAAAEHDSESAEMLAELAALYARRNQTDEAITAGQSAVEREPDNETAHRILGLVYASRASGRGATPEDVTEAIKHLEQARGTLIPDVQVALTLARLHLRMEATDEAIVLLEELLEGESGLMEASLLLSRAYEQAGRFQDAVVWLEGVVEGGRPSSRVLARLGELYERDRRWSDAVNMYERAVARNVRSARIKRQLANALLELGEPGRAGEVLRELVTMRPRDAAGLYLLSEVELELNRFDEAEAVARQLLELEPDTLRGHFALAQVYERRHEYHLVIETLEPALRSAQRQNARDDQLASLMARLGFAYQQVDDYEQATEIYEEAVELMPSTLAFTARLVESYIAGERFADAMGVLERAKVNHPDNLMLARLEAQALSDRGDIRRATDVLEQTLSVHDGEPSAYIALAYFYSEYDRFEDALTLLELAEQRFPDNTSILFQLGAVLERHDRFAEAERTFRRLLEQDSEHAPTLNYLGYMLADRGLRLNESVALLERAIEQDPYNGSYLDSLGWAYFKLEQLDLAEPPLRAAGDQLRNNSVVQDHLGDLLSRLGHDAEAIAAWERSLAGDREGIESTAIELKIDDARRRIGR